MRTSRLEAFSDGVLAIIITVMVLELHEPERADSGGAVAHHRDRPAQLPAQLRLRRHLLDQPPPHVPAHQRGSPAACCGPTWPCCSACRCSRSPPTGRTRPATRRTPVIVYGVNLLAAAIAYYVLQLVIIRDQGPGLAAPPGRRPRPQGQALAGLLPRRLRRRPVRRPGTGRDRPGIWIAVACYVAVALMWVIPDRRIETFIVANEPADGDPESNGDRRRPPPAGSRP